MLNLHIPVKDECAKNTRDMSRVFFHHDQMKKFDVPWFKERMRHLKITQDAIGTAINKDRTVVSKILSGKQTIKLTEITALARIFETTPAEIISRAGIELDHSPRQKKLQEKRSPGSDTRSDKRQEQMTHSRRLPSSIPEIDIRAGMGGGGEAMVDYIPSDCGFSNSGFSHSGRSHSGRSHSGLMETDAIREEWFLPEAYLSELRVSPQGVRIIEVRGDSMEPTLRSGDRVMVNLADRCPSPPGIFALWDGFGVVVKRLEYIPNSDPPRLCIKSDNKLHNEYERTLDEINIIGRIAWLSRGI